MTTRQLRSEGYPRQQKTKPQPHKTNQNSTTELNNTTQSDKTNAMEILLGEAQRIQKATTTTTESKTDIILASLSVAESIVNYFVVPTHSSDDTPPSVDDGECPDHFVPTVLCRNDLTQDPESNSITLHPRVYAMDCEMVLTSSGHELARVTIIQATPSDDDPEHYTVVLDELIKPRRPILDYKTVYSGITPTMLENVTMRIEQVQAAILSIICKEDILIGHSLENDLRAVRVFHENIIDTAVMFRSKNGRKHCA
jgi:DNA polymerase III epsilon subunit-like protein